ncbi:hypothetical protein [Nocardia sp. NPDC050717]|uniref:hypothetical protein n=1 Tax=Nocardia sp. NPDC050717 TaxID=3157221 RepID=UPI0033FB399C
MSEPDGGPGPELWEIRLGIVATEAEMRRVSAAIESVLCPDPEHTPPCPIPWALGVRTGEDLDDGERAVYADVVEQHRIESGTAGEVPRG